MCKNFPTDLHEISREGWQWAKEQKVKFWCRSRSRIRIRIRIGILDLDPDTDPDSDHDTGKTCLGAGMHCPSPSSLYYVILTRLSVLLYYSAFGCKILINFFLYLIYCWNHACGQSRPLKMVLLRRADVCSYWCSIVTFLIHGSCDVKTLSCEIGTFLYPMSRFLERLFRV